MRNLAGQGIEQGGFPRSRSARNGNVLPQAHSPTQKRCIPPGQRAYLDQLLERGNTIGELTNRNVGTPKANWRDSYINAVAVGKTCIHNRAAFVDTPSKRRQDAIDNRQDLLCRLEDALGLKKCASTLEKDRVAPVDHDLSNAWVVEQGLQGPQP